MLKLILLLGLSLWVVPGGRTQSREASYDALVGICEEINKANDQDHKDCTGTTAEVCCEILEHYKTRSGRAWLISRGAQGKCRRFRNVCRNKVTPKPKPKSIPSPVSKNDVKAMCAKKAGGCKTQSREDVERRSDVVDSVASSIGGSRRAARREAEERVALTQAAKTALLAAKGLDDVVDAADTGLYEDDLLLNQKQARAIIAVVSDTSFVAELSSPDVEFRDLDGGRNRRRRPSRKERRRGKRSFMFMEDVPVRKWALPIPFLIDSSIDGAGELLIQRSIADIESKTCIRFKKVTSAQSAGYILFKDFFDPSFCGQSALGKQDKVNQINLNFGCTSIGGAITHNILHSLGSQHEHNRVDRDKYVKINWKNIDPQRWELFDGRPFVRTYSSYGIPYDYHSIMHYRPHTAAIDKSEHTIKALKFTEETEKIMGQRKGLSVRDAQRLSKVYCVADTCIDGHVFCGFYANTGYCTDERYFTYMMRTCPKSCDMCPM